MKSFILILLFFFSSVHAKKNKTLPCSEHIRKLVYAEKEFTGCTVENSVPVLFCEACKYDYDVLTDYYNAFANANDTKTNASCKSIYFDRDRMNIVETVYEQLIGLWNKGFCSECWNDDRNDTDNLLASITAFESCIHREKDNLCIKCKQFYIDVNIIYDNIEKIHKNKICFDIQDMMNRTRITWSKDLKCCKREPNLIAYSAVSGSLSFLIILFYCSVIVLTIRAERNHGTIDNTNGDETTARPASTTVSDSAHQLDSNISIPRSSISPSSSSFRRSSKENLIQKEEHPHSERDEILVKL